MDRLNQVWTFVDYTCDVEAVTPQVVPEISADQPVEEKDAAVVAFRETALRSRFWRTRGGDRLLRWFWKTRFGLWLTRTFADATPEELHGYAFWGMVALGILVTELLGTGWFGSFDRWPTISSTVGHLLDLNSLWGLPVVGLIAIAAFYAMAYETRPTSEGASELYLLRWRSVQLRYGWPLVFGLTAVITLAVYLSGANKYQLGYALYGSLAVFGIAIPVILVRFKSRHVVFPTLFYTFKLLAIAFAGSRRESLRAWRSWLSTSRSTRGRTSRASRRSSPG